MFDSKPTKITCPALVPTHSTASIFAIKLLARLERWSVTGGEVNPFVVAMTKFIGHTVVRPPLIRTPLLPSNSVHLRQVSFGEREDHMY